MIPILSKLYVPNEDISQSLRSKTIVSPSCDLSNLIERKGRVIPCDCNAPTSIFTEVKVLCTFMTSDGNLVVSPSNQIFQVLDSCNVKSLEATAFDYVMLTGLQCINRYIKESLFTFSQKFAYQTVYNPLGAFCDSRSKDIYLITNLKVMSQAEEDISQSLKDGFSFQPMCSVWSGSMRHKTLSSSSIHYDTTIRSKVLDVLALDVTVQNLRPKEV